MKFWTELIPYLIQASFWVGIASPLVLSLVWPWWKHSLGWTIILFDVCWTMFLLPLHLHYEFGVNVNDIGWIATLDIGLLLSTAIIIWRTVLIVRQQITGARRKGKRESANQG